MRHVPYTSPQLIPDLLAGRIQVHVANIPDVHQHIAEGKLRALAVTSLQRLPEYPNLPTVADTLPGYSVGAWGMLLAPAGTPREIVGRLNASAVKSLNSADLRPAILLFGTIGVFVVANSVVDVWLTVVFGVLGAVFLLLRAEVAPLLLGFVLGPMLEENLRRAMLIGRGDPAVFVQSPISAALLAASALLLAATVLPSVRRGRDRAFTG